MEKLVLERYIKITGVLNCKTGVRIGGSKEELSIGVVDTPIIRDPITKLPYLPGSSLKGKMRSLLEIKHDRVGWAWRDTEDEKGKKKKILNQNEKSGEPCGCRQNLETCPVCMIFGPHRAPDHNLGPTRLIVRDALLSEKTKEKEKLEALLEDGLQYAEVKSENIINRYTGVAEHPRPMERVPKDTKFDLVISLRVFKGDDVLRMVRNIKESFDLMQEDYLGSSGTRGYGWVEILDLCVDGVPYGDWIQQQENQK